MLHSALTAGQKNHWASLILTHSGADRMLMKPQVRALADKHGAVLIFDEISSAFRERCGGIHLKFSVSPDLATFSKTMSNGFAMAAVIGRKEIMSAAQDTFISTTCVCFMPDRLSVPSRPAHLPRTQHDPFLVHLTPRVTC